MREFDLTGSSGGSFPLRRLKKAASSLIEVVFILEKHIVGPEDLHFKSES